jgi:hypothetical protein
VTIGLGETKICTFVNTALGMVELLKLTCLTLKAALAAAANAAKLPGDPVVPDYFGVSYEGEGNSPVFFSKSRLFRQIPAKISIVVYI